MCSKIPKCEQKEKLAKCKIANSIPLKTKYPSMVEESRIEGNNNNSLNAGNNRNVLPSSKVPIRSNSKATGQSACNATNPTNKSHTKNKSFIKNYKVENGSILSKEGILNSHFSKKNSCSMKANPVSQHNTIINTFKPNFPYKDKKNMHVNHTIQPKRMVLNKGILKEHCHNSGSLKNASESDINLNSMSKNSRKDSSSNTRKVTFTTASSNDLSKLSDDDVNLMDAIDKVESECKIDKNNIFSPKENYKAGDKQIFNGCFTVNNNKEEKNLSISADIKDDTLMSTSENTYNDNFQRENMKFHNSIVLNSPLKNETLNSEEVTNSFKNIYPGDKQCQLLPSDTVTLKKIIPGKETPNEKKFERRQSIQKQIDEKVEILTAEFLKYIKEKKKRNPLSVISKKTKSKNVTWEDNMSQDVCSKDETSIQDIEMNIKPVTDKNDKNYNREIKSYNLPLNGEVREEKTLINNVKQGLLDSHPLTEVHFDLKISPISSRIPHATSSKKNPLRTVVPLDRNADINMHEKKLGFSPIKGRKLKEAINNTMKYSPKRNLSKGEIDKTMLLRKEFDSITNVCKREFDEEVQLESNKIIYPREKLKNRNSEISLADENCENSRHIHSSMKYNDKNVKKLNNGSNLSKNNCITNFTNQSGEFEEKPEENFSRVPSNNISLEGDIENRLKTYLPFENKTYSSYASGEESGNENILPYEDKENIKCDSSVKLLFSQHMTKIACFTLIFVFSTLLFISVFV